MPRKRRRSTWGSNEDAGGGRRRLRYWADLHDGRGYVRHSKTIVGSRRDGDEELARIRIGHSADAPCPTVGQAWEMWLLPEYDARLAAYLANPTGVRGREGLKPKSHDVYTSMWRNHIAPAWAGVSLSGVRAIDVQSWLDSMTISRKSAEIALSMLRTILDMGVKYEFVDRNVISSASGWRMPTGGRSGPADLWTLDELLYTIWPALWGTPIEAPFILSAFGSCRPGESLGPMLDEVEFDSDDGMLLATIPIVRQVGSHGEPTADGDLKNEWSPRTIVMPEPFSTRLLELRDEGAARGDAWLSDVGSGRPLGTQRLRELFYGVLESAGVLRKEPRALRRSWRSWMASETDIKDELLEKMMGHVGNGVTGRHYLALPPDTVRSIILREFLARPIDVNWDKLGHKPSDAHGMRR